MDLQFQKSLPLNLDQSDQNVQENDDANGFYSENIEESPLKKERYFQDEENLMIPEFPSNENNIKSVKRLRPSN